MDKVEQLRIVRELVEGIEEFNGEYQEGWDSTIKEGNELIKYLLSTLNGESIEKELTFSYDELMSVPDPDTFFQMIQVQLTDNITDSEEFQNRLQFFAKKNDEEKSTTVVAKLNLK